jgi:hypothetical protein
VNGHGGPGAEWRPHARSPLQRRMHGGADPLKAAAARDVTDGMSREVRDARGRCCGLVRGAAGRVGSGAEKPRRRSPGCELKERGRKTYARLQACVKGALMNEDHRIHGAQAASCTPRGEAPGGDGSPGPPGPQAAALYEHQRAHARRTRSNARRAARRSPGRWPRDGGADSPSDPTLSTFRTAPRGATGSAHPRSVHFVDETARTASPYSPGYAVPYFARTGSPGRDGSPSVGAVRSVAGMVAARLERDEAASWRTERLRRLAEGRGGRGEPGDEVCAEGWVGGWAAVRQERWGAGGPARRQLERPRGRCAALREAGQCARWAGEEPDQALKRRAVVMELRMAAAFTASIPQGSPWDSDGDELAPTNECGGCDFPGCPVTGGPDATGPGGQRAGGGSGPVVGGRVSCGAQSMAGRTR